MRRQSSTLVAIGTVQATCLPASSAAIVWRAWSGIGELMCTTSMSGSRSSAAKSVNRLPMPNASPIASSLPFVRWQIAAICASGWRW
jgi:hypothetical protein